MIMHLVPKEASLINPFDLNLKFEFGNDFRRNSMQILHLVFCVPFEKM